MTTEGQQPNPVQTKQFLVEFELVSFIEALKEKHNLTNNQVSAVLCKQAWELLR